MKRLTGGVDATNADVEPKSNGHDCVAMSWIELGEGNDISGQRNETVVNLEEKTLIFVISDRVYLHTVES